MCVCLLLILCWFTWLLFASHRHQSNEWIRQINWWDQRKQSTLFHPQLALFFLLWHVVFDYTKSIIKVTAAIIKHCFCFFYFFYFLNHKSYITIARQFLVHFQKWNDNIGSLHHTSAPLLKRRLNEIFFFCLASYTTRKSVFPLITGTYRRKWRTNRYPIEPAAYAAGSRCHIKEKSAPINQMSSFRSHRRRLISAASGWCSDVEDVCCACHHFPATGYVNGRLVRLVVLLDAFSLRSLN